MITESIACKLYYIIILKFKKNSFSEIQFNENIRLLNNKYRSRYYIKSLNIGIQIVLNQ